jgi:hypothetical protein
METETDKPTLEALDRYDLPRVSAGDRIEFLGFGAPDHFWDHETQAFREIPNQVQPGERGTVTGVGHGQLHVKWDGPHGIMLVVAPMPGVGKSGDDFKPDRFRVIDPEPLTPGPRARPSSLAEREL